MITCNLEGQWGRTHSSDKQVDFMIYIFYTLAYFRGLRMKKSAYNAVYRLQYFEPTSGN